MRAMKDPQSNAVARAEAERCRQGLALAYRDVAREFEAAAVRIEGMTIDQLAAAPEPIRFLHPSTRQQEEALDAWLMRL